MDTRKTKRSKKEKGAVSEHPNKRRKLQHEAPQRRPVTRSVSANSDVPLLEGPLSKEPKRKRAVRGAGKKIVRLDEDEEEKAGDVAELIADNEEE